MFYNLTQKLAHWFYKRNLDQALEKIDNARFSFYTHSPLEEEFLMEAARFIRAARAESKKNI